MNNYLNLQEIDSEQALNLSKFFIKSGQNFFVMGQRGTGKTAIALQAAKESGLKVNYVNLSVIERPDLAGYPNIHSNEDVVTFKSPHFLPTLLDQNPDSIILFDELDKASPEVTAPLLEILQFRTINGKKLNVAACILTGNLPEEHSYSNQISTALLDRCAKYKLKFNFNSWIEWCRLNEVNDLILGFLRTNQDLACGKIEDTDYASPSPRGWVLASDALKQAKQFKISDIDSISNIISGFVGASAGIHFKMWYEYYRKYEPIINSLIDSGQTTFDYKSLTPSEKIVFVISTCYLTKQKAQENTKKKFKYLENMCLFLNNYDVDVEIQMVGITNSFSFEQISKNKLYECKPFFELFTKLNQKLTIKR